MELSSYFPALHGTHIGVMVVLEWNDVVVLTVCAVDGADVVEFDVQEVDVGASLLVTADV